MLAVTQHKTGADRVRWIHGVAADLPPMQVDVATMMGNVAQVFSKTTSGARRFGRPTVRCAQAVCLCSRAASPSVRRGSSGIRPTPTSGFDLDERVGVVETWKEVTDVALPFVSFGRTVVFHTDGTRLTSDSTLRFRTREELVASLEAAQFQVHEVRDALDRPGREFVFLAIALQ